MCGRYTLGKPQVIPKRFNTSNKLPLVDPTYNVAPSQTLPVIVKKSPNKTALMRWGFIPHWSNNRKFSMINIRSETTKEKPYFKKILLNNRCLIPADGFYEWKKVKLEKRFEKLPYFIFLKNHPVFAFAGLYSSIEDAERKPVETFAILTSPPNFLMKPIHNRMPVILDKKDEEKWLDPENKNFDNLYKLLKPYPPAKMQAHVVSKRVNNPRNDNKKLTTLFK